MRDFEYLEATSLKQACTWLADYGGEAKLLAGGNALVILMKERFISPSYIIDIKGLKELDYLRYDPQEGLHIGALTTHRSLERSPLVREHYPVLASLEQRVANVRVRNTGTLGGNLSQAEPQSDPPALLLGLEASVTVVSARGERRIPLREFFVDYYETALQPDEVLTEVQVPPLPPNTASLYYKFTTRSEEAKPCVGVAVILTLEDGRSICQDLRLGLGAVAPTPMRATQAEAMLRGQPPEPELIQQVAQRASQEVQPTSDLYGSAWYKREIVKVLVRRGITQCLQELQGRL